tara:strand:+ start:1349 stop:2056 length:708 start_codon:yes stop_codon:yes gene_type:complete
MSIRVGKYNYKTKKEAVTEEYSNVLIHTTGDLSPYTMKDKNGYIMENYWQFSKIWDKVYSLRQGLSKWHPHIIRWEHGEEQHMDLSDSENPVILPEYWQWREKGFNNSRWVRYPVGYARHALAKGSVIGDADNFRIVDYIEARKKIYFPKYKEIALDTFEFKNLKKRFESGEKLQIVEVDGPTFDADVYPYNLVEDGSLGMNREILEALINNPKQAFGHGYCVAALLLDIDLENC